jgi:hypothetical protein
MGALARHRRYHRHSRSVDGTWQTSTIAFSPRARFIDAAHVDAFRAEVCDPETALLTTSLGEAALDQFTPTLATMFAVRARRSPRKPLVVVACENRVGPMFAALSQRFSGSAIRFLPTVVDRMCLPPHVQGGQAHVSTEEYGSWLVSDAPAAKPLTGLVGDDGTFGVTRNIHRMRKKKRWLVNTPHLTVALHARQQGVPYIDDFVRGRGASILAGIQDECMQALMAYTTDFCADELLRINQHVADRLSSWPMPTDLVLRRLRPERLTSLAGTARELLVEPSNALSSRRGTAPPVLAQAMRMLSESVAATRGGGIRSKQPS